MFELRPCVEADVPEVVAFVAASSPLTVHTPFTYWVTLRYQRGLCFVATEADGHICGYVSGVRDSAQPDLCYLWQMATRPTFAHRRLAAQLSAHFIASARALGCARMQFSIDPANNNSNNLALRYARRHAIELRQIGALALDEADGRCIETVFEMAIGAVAPPVP